LSVEILDEQYATFEGMGITSRPRRGACSCGEPWLEEAHQHCMRRCLAGAGTSAAPDASGGMYAGG
jgi:hypothetical protein